MVEALLDKRRNPITAKWDYRVRWKGYTSEYDTWEPVSNLAGCRGLRRAFDSTIKANKDLVLFNSRSYEC